MKARWLASTALTALAVLTPAAVMADPVSATILIGALASSLPAVIAGATLTSILTTFAVTAALGFVGQALAPKPKNSGPSSEGAFVQNNLGSALDHAIIYGETKVGGVVTYAATTNNETILHRMIAHAGHKCDSVVSYFLNDEEITVESDGSVSAPARFAGKVYIETKLGADDQTAVDLHGFGATVTYEEGDDEWTSDHRMQGICYTYAAFKFSTAAFPNGVATLTAIIRGRDDIHDPRDDSTGWTDNAALCIRDYLRSPFGLAVDDDELDDTAWADAANVSDESVALAAGGTSARYTCNGTFTTASTPAKVINEMLTCMGGMFWYSQGQFGSRAAAWDAPTLSFDENDLIAPLSITTRHSRRDQINSVVGTFRGAESNYQATDYAKQSSATFLAVDGGQEAETDLQLPFTDTSPMAQRIAKIALYRQREQIQCSVSMGLSGFKAKIGDIIQLSNARMGWTNKAFEVIEWSFGLESDLTLTTSMGLQEISEGVYAWDAEEKAFEANNSTLLSAFAVPDIGLTLSDEIRLSAQSIVGVLVAEVTCGQPTRVSQVELQFKESSAPDTGWRTFSTGPLGQHEVTGLVEGTNYDIRARAINTFGIAGDYLESTDFAYAPEGDPPADVTGFDRTISGGTAFLKWTPVSDIDASHYEIRHSSLTSGADWATATVVIDRVSHPASSITTSARSGTFLIKAVDLLGNYSATAASTVTLASELPALGTTDLATENPTFSGAGGTNVSVATAPTPDELRMTTFTSSGSTGTYLFANHIDTGASRTCVVDATLSMVRHHSEATSGAVDWDDISSAALMSTWPGSFDDWTDEDLPWGDFDVKIYARATPDAWSGGASWGPWTEVTGAEMTGRSFEFKAELSNTAANVSPSIATLIGSVSY